MEKPCLAPGRFPSTECRGSWAGLVNPVSLFVFTLWPGGNDYYTPFLKGKQLPYPGHLQKLEIWGRETLRKPSGKGFSPSSPVAVHLHHLPPASWGPAQLPWTRGHRMAWWPRPPRLEPLTPFNLSFCTSFPLGAPHSRYRTPHQGPSPPH